MKDRDRLEHLRGLLARLERMPASADRDWMLAEIRGRAVDVETGTPPAALRTRPQDEADAASAAAHIGRAETSDRPARPQPRPVRTSHRATDGGAGPASRARPTTAMARPVSPALREPARHRLAVDLLEAGCVLCLEDPSATAETATPPWSRGLRG